MKPLSLEFCGINSFSETAKIDFSALTEYGVFGVFGDTGSGKSTILDCISFALYGRISRVSARENSLADVINYKKDDAFVHFEFETFWEGRRRVFRIERTLRRMKAKIQHNAKLYERIGETLIALADDTTRCGEALERIIGLNQSDFEKCIALPQGEFAQFVKSAKADRLRIIARLFDLERYGSALISRANARYDAVSREAGTLRARLDEMGDVSEEGVKALFQEIAAAEEREKKAASALYAAREEETRLRLLAEKRRRKEKLTATLSRLGSVREKMQAMDEELQRLEKANVAALAAKEYEKKTSDAAQAREREEEARRRMGLSEAALRALPTIDEEKEESEIADLTEALALARRAAEEETRRRELVRRRDAVLENLGQLRRTAADPHYEETRAALEEKGKSLGAGNLFEFVAEQTIALGREEYAQFVREITALEEEFPEITPSSAPIREKYTSLSEGEKVQIADLRTAFEAHERAKNALEDALRQLERNRALYESQLKEIARLEEEAARLGEELSRFPQEGQNIDIAAMEHTLSEKKQARKTAREARERAESAFREAEKAYSVLHAQAEAASASEAEAGERLAAHLKAGMFASSQEALALTLKYGDAREAQRRVEAYKQELAATLSGLRELEGVDCSAATDEALGEAHARVTGLEAEEKSLSGELALKRGEAERQKAVLARKQELEAQYAAKQAEEEVAERLKKLLKDNKFMDFVAEEYLQTVSFNASTRLLSLTGGRYFLRYEGAFQVGDNFNGGTLRSVNTLSGGEIFLVSLSLALALSAEICQRSLRPIEFFFLDEGFGTLDGHLVDVVMDSLEKLRSEQLNIGIISHVEELKHRIGRKLIVEHATEEHGSRIHAE